MNHAHAGPLRAVFTDRMPLGDGVALVGDRLAVLPTLFHLLWIGVLHADLRAAPLTAATVIGAGGCAR